MSDDMFKIPRRVLKSHYLTLDSKRTYEYTLKQNARKCLAYFCLFPCRLHYMYSAPYSMSPRRTSYYMQVK